MGRTVHTRFLMSCASEFIVLGFSEQVYAAGLIVLFLVSGHNFRALIPTLLILPHLTAAVFPFLLVSFLFSRLAKSLWVGPTVWALHGLLELTPHYSWFAAGMHNTTVSFFSLLSTFVCSWMLLSRISETILCLLPHLWYSGISNLAFLHPTWPFHISFNFPLLFPRGHDSCAA